MRIAAEDVRDPPAQAARAVATTSQARSMAASMARTPQAASCASPCCGSQVGFLVGVVRGSSSWVFRLKPSADVLFLSGIHSLDRPKWDHEWDLFSGSQLRLTCA
jgi:hypothetical protein